MKKFTALLAGLFFILVAAAPPPGEKPEDYIIGPRDVLEVVVWGETDMSEKVEVASDGTIPFFYVGKVNVAGLSVSQAHDRLVALLADGYIRNPVVIVKIDQFHSKEVQIQGAIASPGTYILTTNDTTLLKLISMAGGAVQRRGNWAFVTRGEAWRELERAKAAAAAAAGPAAGSTVAPAAGSTVGPAHGGTAFGWVEPAPGDTTKPAPPSGPNPPAAAPATVLPPSPPAAQTNKTTTGSDTNQITVDLRGLLDRGDYSQDVVIYPGDFVLIGSADVENPAINFVFVGGAVRSPQQIEFTEGMTALQAAIKAGGFTEIASANRTTITRIGPDGIPVTIRVRLKDIQRGKAPDVPLQAGDRINVPESLF